MKSVLRFLIKAFSHILESFTHFIASVLAFGSFFWFDSILAKIGGAIAVIVTAIFIAYLLDFLRD